MSRTTAGDPDVRRLVAAQEVEVAARYDTVDVGPQPAAGTPALLARLDGEPVGCVVLGALGEGGGEVKRMYVAPAARGRRLGHTLLRAVEELARERGLQVLRLETGTEQPEAMQLYRSAGWTPIPCYGYFADDPTTRCFERVLTAGG